MAFQQKMSRQIWGVMVGDGWVASMDLFVSYGVVLLGFTRQQIVLYPFKSPLYTQVNPALH